MSNSRPKKSNDAQQKERIELKKGLSGVGKDESTTRKQQVKGLEALIKQAMKVHQELTSKINEAKGLQSKSETPKPTTTPRMGRGG